MAFRNQRVFHGTTASALPFILRDGLIPRGREIFLAAGKNDEAIQFPRDKYRLPLSSYAADTKGTNWRTTASADLELDPNVLARAKKPDVDQGFGDMANYSNLDSDWAREKITPSPIFPNEIKRIHSNDFLLLPEIFQDITARKALDRGIDLSYSITNQNLQEALKRSSEFEVYGNRFKSFDEAKKFQRQDAMDRAKRDGKGVYDYITSNNELLNKRRILGIYNQPRQEIPRLRGQEEAYLNSLELYLKEKSPIGKRVRSWWDVPKNQKISPSDYGLPEWYRGMRSDATSDAVRRMARDMQPIQRRMALDQGY